MASTAPVLAPLLLSCRSCRHSIAAKMKVPDDDNVLNNRVRMVVVVIAASTPSRLSLSTAVLPTLSTTATLLPSHRRCRSNATKTEVPDDEDVNDYRQVMVVDMVDVIVVAASAVAVAVPPLPMTATTLPSCRCCCRYSAAKTKVLDDNNINDDGQGIVLLLSLSLSWQQVLPPSPSPS
jgi:hypothetical protein